MGKFITSRDRINKATGAESEFDWSQLPADVAQAILNKIGSGKTEDDFPDTPDTPTCQERIVTLFGHDITFSQALQLTSVALQLLSLLLCLSIAINCRCRCS